jgi:hypothetical protein
MLLRRGAGARGEDHSNVRERKVRRHSGGLLVAAQGVAYVRHIRGRERTRVAGNAVADDARANDAARHKPSGAITYLRKHSVNRPPTGGPTPSPLDEKGGAGGLSEGVCDRKKFEARSAPYFREGRSGAARGRHLALVGAIRHAKATSNDAQGITRNTERTSSVGEYWVSTGDQGAAPSQPARAGGHIARDNGKGQ